MQFLHVTKALDLQVWLSAEGWLSIWFETNMMIMIIWYCDCAWSCCILYTYKMYNSHMSCFSVQITLRKRFMILSTATWHCTQLYSELYSYVQITWWQVAIRDIINCTKGIIQCKMYITFGFSVQILWWNWYRKLSTAKCRMCYVKSRYVHFVHVKCTLYSSEQNFVVAAIRDIIKRRGYAWLPSLLYTSLRSDGPVSTSSATSLSSTLSSASSMSLWSTLSSTSPLHPHWGFLSVN